MAARGRKPGFRMPDDHRTKIANSQVLNRLIQHASGKSILDPSQVTAAVALLKKVLPDLASVEHSGGMDINVAAKQEQRDAAVAAAIRADT